MKCPHCGVSISERYDVEDLRSKDIDGNWYLLKRYCYECNRFTFHLRCTTKQINEVPLQANTVLNEYLVRPKGSSRSPVPKEVPIEFSQDYLEACLVLNDSPKASAALSRRCLQLILRDKAGVKPSDLSSEIQEVLDKGELLTPIRDSIDMVRNIGNFAAHPTKSHTTGEILPVEIGEAEWNLGVIEMLFDYYFVQPERIRAKRELLNAKLRDAGKPEMK